MPNVIDLSRYKTRRATVQSSRPTPPGPVDDVIIIRRQGDGRYVADMQGAYRESFLLAAEHVADLAAKLCRAIRRP